MKKIILLLFVLWHALDSFCQQIPNTHFQESEWITCPFDSSQTILTPKHWFAYQTLNDRWDGPMDSTLCISFHDTLNRLFVELEEIDISKPVFIKSLMDDSTKVLVEKNLIHSVHGAISIGENTFSNFSNNCENGLCSGMILGIEIPDSTGTTTAIRIYPEKSDGGADQVFELCMATERFDSSYIKEVIFKFSLLGNNSNGRRFAPVGFDYFPTGYNDFDRIDANDTVPESSWNSNDSTYTVDINQISSQTGWWGTSHLLMYKDSTYPSPTYPSYVEIFPPENDSIQQTINVRVESWQDLVIQSFANIRGGLLTGSDSIRHILNIINNGGDFCFEPLVELTFDGQSNYIHQGGNIDFHGKTSCLQFSRGSKLIVDDDAFFEYGKNGSGMLVLRSGGSIEIGKNATLLIGNTLIMHELKGVNESQQIFMELNKGSSLIFGENAKIHNGYSIDQNMKLNIFMNGGFLDDSKLSPEDRLKINLIYPEPPVRLEDNVKVFPNPTSQLLNYSFILKNEKPVEIEIYDITGRFIFSKKENGLKGWNEFQIDISSFQTGVYFLKVKMSGEEMISKIVKR